MPFTQTQGPIPGIKFAIPDVYLQATPAGPIPIPLFSLAFAAATIPTNFRFLTSCMPTHNLMSTTPVSISGPGPGAVSGMVCSLVKRIKGSAKFFLSAIPAIRALLDPTSQNGATPNSVGNGTPTQIRLANPSA